MAIQDAPFTLSIIGDETGERWIGDFRAKEFLSHRDNLIKDQRRRELLGNAAGVPDERALSIAIICSELFVRLTKMPRWFEESGLGLDLLDENVLADVYQKALKVQIEARKLREKKDEVDKKELVEEVKKLSPADPLPPQP